MWNLWAQRDDWATNLSSAGISNLYMVNPLKMLSHKKMLSFIFKSYQVIICIESQVSCDVITTAAVKVTSVTVTKFLHLRFVSLVYYQTCIFKFILALFYIGA